MVPRPILPDAISKMGAENYVQTLNELYGETMSLRYFDLYGPRERVGSRYGAVITAL